MPQAMSVPNDQAKKWLDLKIFSNVFKTRSQKSIKKATGRSKAVFVGINYIGTSYELRGCINDAMNLKRFFVDTFDFPDQSLLLTDLPQNIGTEFYPSRLNILNAIQWLIQDAQPGDQLWFSYSGHGGTKYDINGDEVTGYDETIYPIDFKVTGPLVDDELFTLLVQPLPAGVQLTALFDSCHSGTVLDLAYMYNPDGTAIINPGQKPPSFGCFPHFFTSRSQLTKYKRMYPTYRESQASVYCFSGCKDDELSEDVCSSGVCFGAMTTVWIETVQNQPQASYLDILTGLRASMIARGYKQTPCLSTNRPMDLTIPFNI